MDTTPKPNDRREWPLSVGDGTEAPTKRRLTAAEAAQALEDLESTSYLRGIRGLDVVKQDLADGRILAG